MVSAHTPQLNCSLNLLPDDILVRIIAQAGIDNLGRLFGSSFFKLNENLKQALMKVARRKPNLKFQNRPISPTCYDEEDITVLNIKSSREFLHIYNFYAREGIRAVNQVVFCVETAHDFSGIDILLRNLKFSELVKLKMLIQIKDLHFTLDLNKLSELLMSVKDLLAVVKLELPVLGTKGTINVDCFSGVEELCIIGCPLRGSIQNCTRLRKLEYCPLADVDKHLDLEALPSSLKSLVLLRCQRYQNSLQNLPRSHLSLEEICLQFDGEDKRLSRSMVPLLQNLTRANTSKIEFYSSKFESTDLALSQYLSDVARSHQSTPLKLLCLGLASTPLEVSPSYELDLRFSLPVQQHFRSSLASTLKILMLSGDLSRDGQIWELVPSGIESIGCV